MNLDSTDNTQGFQMTEKDITERANELNKLSAQVLWKDLCEAKEIIRDLIDREGHESECAGIETGEVEDCNCGTKKAFDRAQRFLGEEEK